MSNHRHRYPRIGFDQKHEDVECTICGLTRKENRKRKN